MKKNLLVGCGGATAVLLLIAVAGGIISNKSREQQNAILKPLESKVGLNHDDVYGLYLHEKDPIKLEALGYQCAVAKEEGYSKSCEEWWREFEDPNRPQYKNADYFIANCLGASSADYKAKCYGQLVELTGIIERIDNNDGAHVILTQSDGVPFPGNKAVDSKTLANAAGQKGVGRITTFRGVIGNANLVTPDIDNAEVKDIENDRDFAERSRKAAAQQAAEEEACFADGKCLHDKYKGAASLPCERAIEAQAKYSSRWREAASGFFGDLKRFEYYQKTPPQPGILVISGNQVEFQNGFGAYQRMEYHCSFDVRAKEVVEVTVTPF